MNWRDRVKIAWTRAADFIDRAVIRFCELVFFPHIGRRDAGFQRILLYRIGNIGDVLVTLPTLDAIRRSFRDAHIALLTSPGAPRTPGAADLLPPGRWFDELIVYFTPEVRTWQGRMGLLRRLRRGRFDLFVELSNQGSRLRDEVRNMIAARLAGCRRAVGFEVSQHATFVREQALHVPQMQEASRIYRSLAAKLRLVPYRHTLLPVADACREEVSRLLLEAGIAENDRYVVMHPGAKRQTNRWPAERFAGVADEIIRRQGVPVVLTGSTSELPLVERITELMFEKATVLCGRLDLLQMAALIERSCLYVGNDTGPMHIAAAVGTPTVSIFSARDFPQKWYPVGANHQVLRRDVPCSPCFLEICDRDLLCLNRITVEEVVSATDLMLSNSALRVLG